MDVIFWKSFFGHHVLFLILHHMLINWIKCSANALKILCKCVYVEQHDHFNLIFYLLIYILLICSLMEEHAVYVCIKTHLDPRVRWHSWLWPLTPTWSYAKQISPSEDQIRTTATAQSRWRYLSRWWKKRRAYLLIGSLYSSITTSERGAGGA